MSELSDNEIELLQELLLVDHISIANKLNFIDADSPAITYDQLLRSIDLLETVSRSDSEKSRQVLITVCALLWTYKDPSWDALKDYLILVLSRAGFGPSSYLIDESKSIEYGYEGLSSFYNELAITTYQLRNEISIQDEKILITDFQLRVWRKLEKVKVLGVSAPTSAGKSYIISLNAIDRLLKHGGNIIYIVPTLSLISQVSSDFNQLLKKFNLTDYRVKTSFIFQDSANKYIYVLTQEKAISAFSQTDIPFENITMLIVDEIQNIERVSNEYDQRAKILYDCLIELNSTIDPLSIVISGPRVKGLTDFGKDVFNEVSTSDENTISSPVASITYSIAEKSNEYYFKQYSELFEKPTTIKMETPELIKGYGLSVYRDDFYEYLGSFIKKLGENSINIIFSPTSIQARKTAEALANKTEQKRTPKLVNSLINYLKSSVHPDYSLCNTLKKGFAYHHGKTPLHVRYVLEIAVRDKLIPNIICTTTLMQGVNLPAQNVIIRNPYLAIRARNGSKPELTNYEVANLRGRAGRLLKDFLGRTYVLDESSFDPDDDQTELFPESVKEIKAGYQEKFEEFEDQIIKDIVSNNPVNEVNNDYGFLVTYIRQRILRDGLESIDRLNSVGIDLSLDTIRNVDGLLTELQVPKAVCLKNRYWDPLDLDLIYLNRHDFDLPTSVSDYYVDRKIQNLLELFGENFQYYFERYVSVESRLIRSLSISVKEWMTETPLKNILNNNYFDSSKKIENKISTLQNKISYGVPLLIKPVYDIKLPESNFLNFIEMGAFRPITRKLIELGLARETAIYLSSRFFTEKGEYSENEIISILRDVRNNLNYWIKVQLDVVL